jgi:hypothetical protein
MAANSTPVMVYLGLHQARSKKSGFWADPDLADALPPRLRGRVASAPRGQGDTYLEREAATGP